MFLHVNSFLDNIGCSEQSNKESRTRDNQGVNGMMGVANAGTCTKIIYIFLFSKLCVCVCRY